MCFVTDWFCLAESRRIFENDSGLHLFQDSTIEARTSLAGFARELLQAPIVEWPDLLIRCFDHFFEPCGINAAMDKLERTRTNVIFRDENGVLKFRLHTAA